MNRILISLFLTLSISIANAQLQDRIWIFGRPTSGTNDATMYFGNAPAASSPVTALPCGQPNQIASTNGWEEWGVVTSPQSGNLIFYTDGQYVFNNLHNPVDIDPSLPGLESLGGNFSSAQPVALCPVPKEDVKGYNEFFIFSNPTGAVGTSVGIGPVTYRLYYSIGNYFGPVHNLPGPYGLTSVAEGMKIIPCENDAHTLWLVTSLFPATGNERKYVVYKIRGDSISFQSECDMGPVKSVIPAAYGAGPASNIVYSEANTPYGITNVGVTVQYISGIFVCQFDNLNGQFLPATVKMYTTGYPVIPAVYDLEFSPGGHFLYYTVYDAGSNYLYQMDLQDSLLSPVLIKTYGRRYSGGLALGADSLVYHIYDSGYDTYALKMGRILTPDVEYIPGTTDFNLFYEDNFLTYYNTIGVNFCEFLIMPHEQIVTGVQQENNSLKIYPNPAGDHIIIDFPDYSVNDAATAVLMDISGKLLFSRPFEGSQMQIDLSGFSSGIYFLKMTSNKSVIVKKFVKE